MRADDAAQTAPPRSALRDLPQCLFLTQAPPELAHPVQSTFSSAADASP